jgi:hypothetical protein
VSEGNSTPTSCKFLNIDLDFFLSDIALERRSLTRRVSKRHFKPWPEEAVRKFLEQQCGLSRQSPIVGRFAIHHHAVFDYWRCLIKTMPPGSQIDLTHVDAHADFISLCDMGFLFIQKTLLCYRPDQRLLLIDRNWHHVTLANYMSFALACRWINRIEYVTHPRRKQEDIFDVLFHRRGGKLDRGHIELRSRCDGGVEPEPTVPITYTPATSFSKKGFERAFLCQSPNYTPQTADALIPVFEDYIDFNAA